MRASRRERGVTLVEATVVLLVMTAVMLGLYELVDSSNRLARQETQTSDAQQSASAGIYEMSRLIRQAGVGSLSYASAVLPIANNSPGGVSVADLLGNAHFIRKGTDVLQIRGVLQGDRYSLTPADVTCDGACDGSTAMTVTIRGTADNGVVNFPAGGAPTVVNKTRPFYFVVTDSSFQAIASGSSRWLLPLYYVGLVDTAGSWFTRNGDAYTFTMKPQDAGARKLDAGAVGSNLLKPVAGGAVDQILFFVDEGGKDATGSRLDSHPALVEAAFDPSTGRYDVQPLSGDVEDFQVAYGIDGIDGTPPDRGVSPASVDTSAVNKDEWVGNVATEVETSLPVSSAEPKRVDAFLAPAPAGSNPTAATAALRSVWLGLVVKAADPEIRYDGPGSRGVKVLDSAAVAFSDPSSTGRPYRRRLQSFVVTLKNYQ